MNNQKLQADIFAVYDRIVHATYYLSNDDGTTSDIMRGVVVGENLAKAEQALLEIHKELNREELKENEHEQEYEPVECTLDVAKVVEEKTGKVLYEKEEEDE